MFKYVESMRKVAFRICSRSYGGKTRDGNEALYDSYPLKRFTRLLCFEDDDEARAACQHYNITVGEENGLETIFWRRSSFRERKDPEKGTVILLKPRKMTRTIESKLKGATRLAVCRGEVSGEGCHLSTSQAKLIHGRRGEQSQEALALKEQAKAEALSAWKEKEQERKDQLARKVQEEENAQRMQDELQQKESERRLQEQRERNRQAEEAKQRQLEYERREKERLAREYQEREQEQKRIEMERAVAMKRAQEEERRRRLASEQEEELRRQEEQRIRAEEERRRREEEEIRRQHAEQKRRQQELEAERLRQEEERQRLEALKRQEEERLRLEMERKAREEERKRLEAEALRLQQELQKRVSAAKKRLVWRRLLDKTRILAVSDRSHETLCRLGSPSEPVPSIHTLVQRNRNYSVFTAVSRALQEHFGPDLRKSMERILRNVSSHAVKTTMLAELTRNTFESRMQFATNGSTKKTLLFKVAVIFPQANSAREQSICGLIRSWIDSRLKFGEVSMDQCESLDVRFVVVDGSTKSGPLMCDAAILVVPPSDSIGDRRWFDQVEALGSAIENDTPSSCFISPRLFRLPSVRG